MTTQINPNNINGNYPIAGQDNNSQGFRDNFTNTKLNFQYAADEITDLQNKVLLKSALTGQALDNNMNNNLLYAARIQAFSATKVDVSLVSNVYTLNYASGHYQAFSTTTPISVLAFTNFPPNGQYGYYKVQIQITNVNHVIEIPAAVSLGLSGIQGISPGTPGVANTISFDQTGFYEFGFGTYDSGTTITIFDLNRALTNFTGGDLQVQSLLAQQTVAAGGNVSGGNFNTTGVINADGTVTGGNVVTGGFITAGGNITAANFSSTGKVSGIISGKLRPEAAVNATAGNEPLKFTAGAALLATPAAGAFEFDGRVFYATPRDEQRGLLPSIFLRAPATNNVLLNTATAQDLFAVPNGVNLADAAIYSFDGQLLINRTTGTNAHTTSLSFLLTGTLISISYLASVSVITSGSLGSGAAVTRYYGTGVSPLVITPSSSSANEFITVQIQGLIRTDTAGNFAPQISYSTLPGGAPSLLANSYLRFTPIGNSSFESLGDWS
jgi:cytoskeletal protein CcmA (bactofilin family)